MEKECSIYIKNQEEIEKEYQELYPEYKALCNRAKAEEKSFTASSFSLDSLKKEMKNLKAEIEKDLRKWRILVTLDVSKPLFLE